MNSVTLGSRTPASFSGDTLVVGLVRTKDEVALAAGVDLPKDTAKHLRAAIDALRAKAGLGDVTVVPAVPGVKARKVALVGLGETAPGTDQLRRAAGSALRALVGDTTVALALPHTDRGALSAIAEGALSGCYTFTTHKSATPTKGAAAEGVALTVFSGLGRKDAPKDVLARAEIVARNVAFARDLVNTAPNVLYPQSFADEVAHAAKASTGKVTISVLDEKDLAEGGFGGIVGVGQGSSRPPRIVTMTYRPARSRKAPKVALVGKGITFDTGGVCIKPAASMATMKSDMAGAAAVAATVLAAAELEVPVTVTGYLCLAENMPGSNAQRPGDVVTMRNGTTVEILDTDAEGRMVLADGMCLAAEDGPDVILDIATLTGACMVALGPRIYGVMSNDEAISTEVTTAAAATDEPAWPLPLPADLRPGLDSFVADIAHKADRWGGALTAGLFLQEFAKTSDGAVIPWAHLDIAGPSFNESGPWGHLPKGGTGVGVASMLALVEGRA